jgi:hypothetical protein
VQRDRGVAFASRHSPDRERVARPAPAPRSASTRTRPCGVDRAPARRPTSENVSVCAGRSRRSRSR